RADAFDRRDLLAGDRGDRRHARASRLTVDVDRAGAAEGSPAAEFRAGQAQLVAEDPQHGSVVGQIDVLLLSVDLEFGHAVPPCRWWWSNRIERRALAAVACTCDTG